MLNFNRNHRIFVHTGVTDMRKGFSGLSAIVRDQFAADPTDGSLFARFAPSYVVNRRCS